VINIDAAANIVVSRRAFISYSSFDVHHATGSTGVDA